MLKNAVAAKDIAQLVGGIIEGNPDVLINKPAKIEEADGNSITFLSNPKYEKYVYQSDAGAILVSNEFVPTSPIAATLIRVNDVYATVAFLLDFFGKITSPTSNSSISKVCSIAESAKIGENCSIGDFTVVSQNAMIGDDSKISPQVFIGQNVIIGKNCVIQAGVKIYHDCVIGDNCILHANIVIGSDGFGFAPQADGTYKKVAQIGNVVIGNDVEIGANTTIDRATMGSTLISNGVKLDNLIQIAHNVEIGENTVIASQTGVAGSTKIGKNCMIGGQVGFAGHIQIADGTKIQAQSGIASTIKEPNTALFGSPAIAYSDFIRSFTVFKKLPDLSKRLDKLEKLFSNKY